jgi:hypothetical protein
MPFSHHLTAASLSRYLLRRDWTVRSDSSFRCRRLIIRAPSSDATITVATAFGSNSGPCFAPFPGLLHDRLQATQPEAEGFRGMRAEDRIPIIGLDCSVQDWTTAWHRGPVINKVSNVLFELLDAVRLFIQIQKPHFPGGLPGVIECLRREFLLTGEMTVDAALLSPVAAMSSLSKGSFVAALIKRSARQPRQFCAVFVRPWSWPACFQSFETDRSFQSVSLQPL